MATKYILNQNNNIMNRVIIVFLIFSINFINAQVSETIEVGFTKSAYLIFDGKELKYDCGSEDVIVRNSKNILILQAAVEKFEETNLFVEVEGEYMVFIVKYVEEPNKYMYNLQKSKSINSEDIITNNEKSVSDEMQESARGHFSIKKANYNEAADTIRYYRLKSEEITAMNGKIHNRGIRKYKIGLYLKDVLIHNDVFYFKFEYENKSNIGYNLDFLQYKVQGVKRRIKGESQQNIYLKPLYEYNIPTAFNGKDKGSFVVVFDKFALTKNKKLRIEFWEDNGGDMNLEGGRKINFDIFSKDILNVGSF